MKIDLHKGLQSIGSAVGKTAGNVGKTAADIGKKAADGTVEGVQALANKAQENSMQNRLKKYNPLFPEEYQSKEFHLPELIQVVNGTERDGVDVCEGAIGWKSDAIENIDLAVYYNTLPKSF